MHKKNVAVIGAGPSGLTTMKALLEEGHHVTCFEKSNDLGGVYRYDIHGISAYASAQLTSSAYVTSFSDFPIPPDAPFHFKHDQYFQYLHRYAEGFGLKAHIKLRHAVRSVEHLPQGTWRVQVFDEINQKEEQYLFDAVAVCAGVHHKVSIPDIEGKDTFEGDIVHSGFYKTADAFRAKNVVIVGGGESGSDIIDEVSKVTTSCVASLRRGVLVIPRLVVGIPNDFYLSRLYCASPLWFFKIKHQNSLHWPTLFLIALFVLIPLNILAIALYMVLSSVPVAIGLLMMMGFGIFAIYALTKTLQFQLGYIGYKESQVIARLSDLSQVGHDEQFATKCHGIARAIAQERCSLKPGIKRFTPHGVEFTDGTHVDADAVIFCTGYVTSYPFLGIDRLDCRDLYKNCFIPSMGPSLCFMGLARPAIGAIPAIAEMQARWFAQVLSAKAHLPALDVMKTAIVHDARLHKISFAVVSDRITGLVDFSSYMDQVAEFIGCKPRLKDLWKDPVLLFRVHFNPFMGCQYRLTGPHQKKEVARKIMTGVPLNIFQILANSFLLPLVAICEALYRLGFKYFKPVIRLE